eukprot:CCRYP_008276-RA/>CCRYP_008276-RA protein AED:0.39 eAED:0.51 QI:0/0/0/1/1/0.5/2/0/399
MTLSIAELTVVAALLICCCSKCDSFRAENRFGRILVERKGSNRSRIYSVSYIALRTSVVPDLGDGHEQRKEAHLSLDELPVGTISQNPFLPILSNGLHRVSLAMDKSTSDQLFLATPSLQRLRQQIMQLTEVGPSSLGERAGLGFSVSLHQAGTIVGLYPAHALGYELIVPVSEYHDTSTDGDEKQNQMQDLSMFLAGNDEDTKYFSEHPHEASPYLHATDQPLFQRSSLLSPLFDEEKKEIPPPLYLDVNPNRNHQLDRAWTSHYINDGASLLDSTSVAEDDIEQYYARSTRAKNCIHIPFGPSPVLATVTTKKVRKGDELFTTYGVVYWAGAIESARSKSATDSSTLLMTEKIHSLIIESARDLQKAMNGCRIAYAKEMVDFEETLNDMVAKLTPGK